MGRVNKYYESILQNVKDNAVTLSIELQMQILFQWGDDLEYAMRYGKAKHEFRISGIEVPK